MLAIVWGFGLFFVGFVAHVIVWRIQRPRKGGRALLIVFIAAALGGLIGWQLAGDADLVDRALGPADTWVQLHVLVVSFSLAAAYIASYPAAAANSPTPRIVHMISEAGEKGLPSEALYESLNRDELLVARLDDLVASDLACKEDGVYRPTEKGRRLALLFMQFRRLLGAPTGG